MSDWALTANPLGFAPFTVEASPAATGDGIPRRDNNPRRGQDGRHERRGLLPGRCAGNPDSHDAAMLRQPGVADARLDVPSRPCVVRKAAFMMQVAWYVDLGGCRPVAYDPLTLLDHGGVTHLVTGRR